MFSEPEETKLFETNNLAAAPNDTGELKLNIQKNYVAKDTSWTLSSIDPSIPVSAPKQLSSNMSSRSVFPKKIPSFAY